jgi:hypothetical protein
MKDKSLIKAEAYEQKKTILIGKLYRLMNNSLSTSIEFIEYETEYTEDLYKHYIVFLVENICILTLRELIKNPKIIEIANSLGIEFIKILMNNNTESNKLAESFLNAGLKFNVEDEEGSNILHILPQKEYYIDKSIIKAVDKNKINDEGLTPLHYAIIYKKLHYAQYLIDHGAETNIINPHTGESFLHDPAIITNIKDDQLINFLKQGCFKKIVKAKNYDKLTFLDLRCFHTTLEDYNSLFNPDIQKMSGVTKYSGIRKYVSIDTEDMFKLHFYSKSKVHSTNFSTIELFIKNMDILLPLLFENTKEFTPGKKYFAFNFYQKYIKANLEKIFVIYNMFNNETFKTVKNTINKIDEYIAQNFFEIACIAKTYNGHTFQIPSLTEIVKGLKLVDVHLARGLIEEHNNRLKETYTTVISNSSGSSGESDGFTENDLISVMQGVDDHASDLVSLNGLIPQHN